MQKKNIGMLSAVAVFIVFRVFSAEAWASDNYFNRSGEKLARGVTNIVFSPMEIFKSIEDDFLHDQIPRMITVAPFEGILRMFGRVLVGCYETATFYVPQKPILKPAYVFQNLPEYAKSSSDVKLDAPW